MAAATALEPAPLDAKASACLASLVEWRASPALAASLTPSGSAFLHAPSTLRRYAVARNGDLEAAKAALQATLAWRETFLTPPLGCTVCPADPFTHCFHVIGQGAPTPAAPSGSVVVYACAARAKQNESADAVRHMIHSLEHAWAAPHVTADRLCWIVDFNGFGLRHAMGGSTASSFLSTFSAHLPERLGVAILLNPPSIFDMLLAVIRPFVDARTMGKVKILRPKAGQLAEELRPHGVVCPRQLAWLEKVMGMAATPGSLPDREELGEDLLPLLTPSAREEPRRSASAAPLK